MYQLQYNNFYIFQLFIVLFSSIQYEYIGSDVPMTIKVIYD